MPLILSVMLYSMHYIKLAIDTEFIFGVIILNLQEIPLFLKIRKNWTFVELWCQLKVNREHQIRPTLIRALRGVSRTPKHFLFQNISNCVLFSNNSRMMNRILKSTQILDYGINQNYNKITRLEGLPELERLAMGA